MVWPSRFSVRWLCSVVKRRGTTVKVSRRVDNSLRAMVRAFRSVAPSSRRKVRSQFGVVRRCRSLGRWSTRPVSCRRLLAHRHRRAARSRVSLEIRRTGTVERSALRQHRSNTPSVRGTPRFAHKPDRPRVRPVRSRAPPDGSLASQWLTGDARRFIDRDAWGFREDRPRVDALSWFVRDAAWRGGTNRWKQRIRSTITGATRR